MRKPKLHGYVTYVYNSGTGWARTNPPPTFQIEPQPGYAEAFWISSGGTRNWKRTVSVWP